MMGVGVCVLRVSGDVGSCRRVSGVVCTFRWLNEQKNLNNLGIRLANCQNLFGKIDFLFKSIRKNRFSDPEKPEKSISVLKVFGKIDFHYSGEVTHPSANRSAVAYAYIYLKMVDPRIMIKPGHVTISRGVRVHGSIRHACTGPPIRIMN